MTVVVLVDSGVDDSGAIENMMDKNDDDVSDIALTRGGLWGVVSIRNKIIITLNISIVSVHVAISVNPVAESSPCPCSLCTFFCYNLFLFHLHPQVRSPGAGACVIDNGALAKDGANDATDVTVTAGGIGGVAAKEN